MLATLSRVQFKCQVDDVLCCVVSVEVGGAGEGGGGGWVLLVAVAVVDHREDRWL